jgi:hypothetical protein
MWTSITCDEPYLSIEDIIRLVSLSNGTNTAIRIVKV